MKIDLPLGIDRLHPAFHATAPCLLLHGNGRAVSRQVLVDLDPKRLTDAEPARA